MDRAEPELPRPPIHPLTSLRFFAALLVVLYHTYATFLPSKPLPTFANDTIAVGFLGVSFFFILSGFILAYNYLGPPGESAAFAAPSAHRAFFVARFARIYPLYLLALFVHAPFIVAHRLHRDPSTPVALGKLAVSFTLNAALLQAWLLKLWGGWNSPGWSLSAEAFFYAAFPVAAPLLWRSRRRDSTLLLGIYAATLVVPLLVLLLRHRGHLALPSDEAFETFPLFRLPEFVFGVVLARAHLRARAGGAAPLFRYPSLLWGAGVILIVAAVLVRARLSGLLLHNGLLAPSFALVILGFSGGDGPIHRLLSTRPLRMLGEASYGVYILHVPLYFWCCYLARAHTRLADQPALFGVDAPILCAAYLVTLVGLSVLLFQYVEEPARRWIRRLAAPRAAAGAGTAPGPHASAGGASELLDRRARRG